MRSITQGREPDVLRRWKRDNRRTPQNLCYENIPGPVLRIVKQVLLNEQKGLCGYTLQRLPNIDASHLEHIEPQNQHPEKSTNYSNMLACFPSDGGDTSHGYGAPVKGGQHIQLNVDFVSPHSRGCEKRFIFTDKGKIECIEGDQAAKKTIATLRLDCPILNELRQRALATYGLTISQRNLRVKTRRLGAAEASRLAAQIMRPDANDQLDPFCTAIAQVAKSYAQAEGESRQGNGKEK